MVTLRECLRIIKGDGCLSIRDIEKRPFIVYRNKAFLYKHRKHAEIKRLLKQPVFKLDISDVKNEKGITTRFIYILLNCTIYDVTQSIEA